jgi:hypothetical protein
VPYRFDFGKLLRFPAIRAARRKLSTKASPQLWLKENAWLDCRVRRCSTSCGFLHFPFVFDVRGENDVAQLVL